MNSLKLSSFSSSAKSQAHAEYFYDMLNQLLIIGRQAGGDALIDATLIGGLLATRRAQTDQSQEGRRCA